MSARHQVHNFGKPGSVKPLQKTCLRNLLGAAECGLGCYNATMLSAHSRDPLGQVEVCQTPPPLERAARAASCRTPRTSTPGVWASLGAWATETRATGRGFAGAGQGFLLWGCFELHLELPVTLSQKWLVDIHPRLNSSNGSGTQKNHIQMWVGRGVR